MNTKIEHIHDFLENVKDKRSLFERILDDIEDGERLNNGDDKHIVYYLQLSEESKSREMDYWANNIRKYTHLYVYAMLFNWEEQWADDEIIKIWLDSIQRDYSDQIASEIAEFKTEDTCNIPSIVLREMEFISDAFQWKYAKEIPTFTETQKQNIEEYRQNYCRYIKLINDEKHEDTAKCIDKYLSYCMTIDDVYKSTKCLTSFLFHLSGSDHASMDIETMLKTISAESCGVDKIRQILIKGEKQFPLDIVKMAIYSKPKIDGQSKNNSVGIDSNSSAKATLARYAEDFEILKKNSQFVDLISQLTISSFIREKIINDKSVEALCSDDLDAAALRKETFDDIKKLQHAIIDTIVKKQKILNTNLDCSVKDFGQAKIDLCDLAKKESNSLKPINEITHPLLINDPQFLSHLDHLSEIEENCSAERYRILIMGEYQSGKTTFIDAINGMHIGAIGNGNTTSAVPIEISYSEERNVIPLFKRKEDLLGLLSSIQKYIKDFSVANFDLDNVEERNALYEKVDDFRHDKDNCPKVKEPGLKTLAICSLILKYYGDEKLENIKSGSVQLEKIATFSSFPERIETRWYKKGGDNFSFEEAVFAFVRKFQCFIPSENLKSLNCTLVDSPGLFSNDYDTKITEEEMKNANAILYLLPYDKEVGKDTCGSLYILRNDHPNFLRKLFLVNNRSFVDKKNFYETNREVIKEMFGPAMELYKIDARLAYLGTLKESYDNNKLSRDEITNFILSCQNATEEENPEDDVSAYFNSFLEAWDDCIYPYKRFLRSVNTPTPKDVVERSKLLIVLRKLLEFIETNMVYSIIVSEGIHKLYKELDSMRKGLILQYVKPYLIKKTNLEKEWENRFDVSSKFSKSAKRIVNRHFFEDIDGTPSLHQRLSRIAYSTVFTEDSIDLMIISICKKIYNNKWSLAKCGKNKTKIEKLITPEITKLFSDFISNRIKGNWNDLLQNGQNQILSDAFISEIKLIETELDSLWQDLFANDDDFISSRNIYFELSKDASNITMGVPQNKSANFSTGSLPLMGAILNDIATITTAILVFLTPTIVSIALAVTSNPAGWVVGGVATILAGGYYAITGDDWMETKFIKSQAPIIKKEISDKGLGDTLYKLIEKEMKISLEKYAAYLEVNIKRMSDERDIALSTPEEEKERKCYASLKELIEINENISDYVEFCNRHIDYA